MDFSPFFDGFVWNLGKKTFIKLLMTKSRVDLKLLLLSITNRLLFFVIQIAEEKHELKH